MAGYDEERSQGSALLYTDTESTDGPSGRIQMKESVWAVPLQAEGPGAGFDPSFFLMMAAIFAMLEASNCTVLISRRCQRISGTVMTEIPVLAVTLGREGHFARHPNKVGVLDHGLKKKFPGDFLEVEALVLEDGARGADKKEAIDMSEL